MVVGNVKLEGVSPEIKATFTHHAVSVGVGAVG